MSWTGALSQLLEIVLALALAPLLTGWVNQCRAWLQNKSAPPLLQPYYLLHKLFNKESVVAEHASPLFRAAPYIVFGCMTLACSIIPTLSTDLPLSLAADAIALVGLFALAPLLLGWVNQWRAWLQNRSGPGILQPYRQLNKLFLKDAVVAEHASPLFRMAPYVVFGCMTLACGIIPTLSTDLPLSPAADAIALVGLFALARVFISLAAMDVGTAFGSLGARREMLIGFLAEPALLMVLFTAALISHSTSLTTIVDTLAHRELAIYPSLAFAGVAFTIVSLAENARVPVDNPATHLELTMIHEALILEYSGRHLALIEWAAALKLFAYSCAGLALFFPWGVAQAGAPLALLLATPILVAKLAAGGVALAVLETLSAKMRIFRVPEFLATAFLLAVIAMLVRIFLGA